MFFVNFQELLGPGMEYFLDVKFGRKKRSQCRSLRKKLFRKLTNRRWGKQNHVTTKSCSERSIPKKERSAATGCHHPFAKKKSAHRGPLLLVRSAMLYRPRPRQTQAQSAAYTWTHERERPLGLGGRQRDGGAPCVIRKGSSSRG